MFSKDLKIIKKNEKLLLFAFILSLGGLYIDITKISQLFSRVIQQQHIQNKIV